MKNKYKILFISTLFTITGCKTPFAVSYTGGKGTISVEVGAKVENVK